MDILNLYLELLPALVVASLAFIGADFYGRTDWHWTGRYSPSLVGWIGIIIGFPFTLVYILVMIPIGKKMLTSKEERLKKIREYTKQHEEREE